ncbi:MAG TPA: hypothetical protein VHV08_08730 [Pirellulales bacterium]|nr:hypothetical protein [Pirellulales bacterium]
MAILSRTKGQLMRGERLQIMLSPDELRAVDDYRFQQRMPSRAAAVRELFRLGLASAGLTQLVDGKKSSDFGVFGDGEADASPATSQSNE